MKRWIAIKSIACRWFGMAVLALALLCGLAGHEASAQQERPFWRGAKQREQLREQREAVQEERRQGREREDERRQGRERVREERRHDREHIQEERRQERRELQQQRQEQVRERGEEARRPQAGENQDRALNRDEAQRHFPRLGKRFDEIDSNRDGVITQDEVRAFRQSRARARVWGGDGDDPRD